MAKVKYPKIVLSEFFKLGLDAVHGTHAVENKLKDISFDGLVAVLAVGKAAAAMMSGAKNQLNEQIHSALIITKKGHADFDSVWPCIEAGHPLPDERSLEAGDKLLKFIENIPQGCHLLALISGGTSSLVEVLPEGMELKDLQKMNQWLLGSGLPIEEMNRIRQSVSLIKGGKLLQYMPRHNVTQLLISDVKNDDPAIIGSGLFVNYEQKTALPDMPDGLSKYIQPEPSFVQNQVLTHIVASNEMACQVIIAEANLNDFDVFYHGQTLYGDVFDIAKRIASHLKQAEAGIHLWGGETTIKLPGSSGRGGRNQSLALALAVEIEGSEGITVLVAASDGSDGATEDAGAIIDGSTISKAEKYSGYAQDCLTRADAGTFLDEAGDLLSTGPTGTNVMDILIAIIE